MNLKFYWKKGIRPIQSDEVYINLKTVIFIAASIVSAFINLVFIANLTLSAYSIGSLISIPAAIVLGILSIVLDLSKCLHAIKINTLKEFTRYLKKFKYASDGIVKLTRRWQNIYVLYVALSIITSVSLSSISIGSGITKNSNTLKQIDELIVQGEQYSNVDATAKNINIQNLVSKATDTSEQDAIDWVNKQTLTVWPKIQEWQEEYTEFKNSGLDPNSRTVLPEEYSGIYDNKSFTSYYAYWLARDNEINALLSSSKYSSTRLSENSINKLTLTAFEEAVKENYLKTYKTSSNDEATAKLNALTDTTMEEAYGWIETLNNIEFINPSTGNVVVFDTDKNKSVKVLVSSALTQLKSLRVDIENDSGDIGKSSKIFMQLGSLFNKTKSNQTDLNDAINVQSESSLGPTEIMMMVMLLFLSLLCELAINQFSGKSKITRKMVEEHIAYLPEDFDKNTFIMDVITDQYEAGDFTKEEYDKEIEGINDKMISNLVSKYKSNLITDEEFTKQKQEIFKKMFITADSIKEEYEKKKHPTVVMQPLVPVEKKVQRKKSVKKVVEPTKAEETEKAEEPKLEEPKVEETVTVETPVVTVENVPVEAKPIIVKSAEKELEELLEGK